jgi:hypothetical protein
MKTRLDASDDRSGLAIQLLNERLDSNTRVLYLTTGQEKAWVGCDIFSLSFALKMHKFPDAMDRIHQINEQRSELKVETRDGADAAQLLPLHFYKHAQSSRLIDDVLAARGENPPVNSSNKTIIQRFIAHRGPDGKSQSLDEKRFALSSRAMSYTTARDLTTQMIGPALMPLTRIARNESSQRLELWPSLSDSTR